MTLIDSFRLLHQIDLIRILTLILAILLGRERELYLIMSFRQGFLYEILPFQNLLLTYFLRIQKVDYTCICIYLLTDLIQLFLPNLILQLEHHLHFQPKLHLQTG